VDGRTGRAVKWTAGVDRVDDTKPETPVIWKIDRAPPEVLEGWPKDDPRLGGHTA